MSRWLLLFATLYALPAWAQVVAPPVAVAPPVPVAPTPAPVTRDTLIQAASQGKLDEVKTILAAHPTFLSGTENQSPLQAAVSNGQLEVTRFLLDKGADPNTSNYNGSPLSQAVTRYDANWKPLAELLVAKGADVNASDENSNQTILGRTLQNGSNGQTERVQWLLDKGADVNAVGRGGQSALDVAITNSSSDVWKLIVAKADPKKRDDLGQTALFSAVRANKIEVVRALVERGAEVNAQDASGDSPLHLAARGPLNSALFSALLGAGANANLVNTRGDAPLHIALRRDIALDRAFNASTGGYPALPDPNAQPRGLQLAPLIDKTDINLRDGGGFSPLLLCVVGRDAESRDLILDRTPKSDATTQLFNAVAGGETAKVTTLLTAKPYLVFFRLPDGSTPLHIAALWGTLGAAGELVKRGADVNARDGRGQTPLQAALRNPTARFARRARNMATFLLDNKAGVNLATPEGDAPLHLAARAGDADLIQLLLSKGAAINARGMNGETPLLIATNKDTPLALYQTLIDKGADVNARTGGTQPYGGNNQIYYRRGGYQYANAGGGTTPLHRAILTGRTELVRVLLEHGANIEAPDDQGQTPLVAVIQRAGYNDGNGSVSEMLTLLLAKGANPKTRFQNTDLLSFAIQRGRPELVKTLLATKKVSLGTSRGSSLTSVVSSGNIEMVRVLLDAGVSPTEPDQYGRTPLQAAYSDDIKKLLNERIAALSAKPDTPAIPPVKAEVVKP